MGNMRYCPQCGHALEPTARFCENCGAAVSKVPDGQKNAFLVQAILESEEKEVFETTLRRVLREELQAVPSQPVKQPEEAIPQEMMGFLGSLLGED